MTYPNLRAEMARKGIKQSDIATAIGSCVSSVNRMLNGNAKLPIDTATAIRDALFRDCRLDYLFGEEDANGES